MDERDKIIEDLRQEIQRLQEENRFLKEQLLKLERRLGLDSTTSSKPPSSDGLKKGDRKRDRKNTSSGRGQGKEKGGQKGHKGKTLEQTPTPDSIIQHKVDSCSACHADLSQAEACNTTKRQVFEVEIRRYVTEHQAETKKCTCGAHTTAPFPDNVTAPVQIGDQLRAFTIYLGEHFIAKNRLSEVTETLFGIPISDTTLFKYTADLAQNLQTFYQESLAYLQTAHVKHSDETGMRVSKKTQWMHVLSDDWVTYLKYQPKRKIEYENLMGIIVHDHYNSYLQLSNVTHAFCNAHILRELKALIEYEKEPWAQDMHALLQKACHSKNEGSLDTHKAGFFRRIYDKIVERGLTYHESLPPLEKLRKRGRSKKREGHNLLNRLRDFKEGTLLFMSDESVPFTNNQAERDLRMVKVKQKVSGCFRTVTGAQDFAVIRSYIGTIKKNGGNVLEMIRKALSQKVRLQDVFVPYKSGLPVLIASP